MIEWPDLGLSARAELAEQENPELCEEFISRLPFESIMNNAVVTDGSMYCWVPMLSFARIHKKERIDLAPPGRLRYSQNTGNKLIVQYASCNEDVYGAVLGQVLPEDLETVRIVGERAKNAIFMTKEEIHVRVSLDRADENFKTPAFISADPGITAPESASEEVRSIGRELIRLGLEASSREPEEHKSVRTGQNSGMGSCGQYFSTWEFVYSLSRDISMYTLYPIARLCRDDGFTVRQLEKIYMEIEPTYSNLLGSYGMKQFRALSLRIRELIRQEVLTKEELRYLVDAMTFYSNMIAQWTYFYYPWGIGCACYRFDEEHRTYQPAD